MSGLVPQSVVREDAPLREAIQDSRGRCGTTASIVCGGLSHYSNSGRSCQLAQQARNLPDRPWATIRFRNLIFLDSP
jgi:hypothetical protein